MGTHTWNEDCPACGFGGMIVYADRSPYFGADCPVCGYRRWTEEKIPDAEQLELAKKLLSETSAEQIEQVLVECDEEGITLVEKFRKEKQAEELAMELQTYIEKYLGTLYLQHRSKMREPLDEEELVMRVREGIAEDTRKELTMDEVERLIDTHVPAPWRSLSPREADAQWFNEAARKGE